MVYVLKNPIGGSKGIIIFTNKEKEMLENTNRLIKKQLSRLTEKYVVGMHWGWYANGVGEVPFVDFHLAAPGTVSFSTDTHYRIPLCSRNFTADYFEPLDVPKRWDILCIAQPKKYKRLTYVLQALKKCYRRNIYLDVLFLCPTPEHMVGAGWDREFFRMYESLFSAEEKRHIDLFTPPMTENNIHPLPNDILPYLYNSSKSFTIFSKKEGACKVISESLLCGTPVIARSDLQGGGLDYLDEQNSRVFSTLDEACDAFIDVAQNPESYAFDPSYLREDLAESHTAERLETELQNLFEENGLEYKGEIEKEGLAFKLPSHEPTIPKQFRENPPKGDLKSHTALVMYIDYLLESETSTKRYYQIPAHMTETWLFDDVPKRMIDSASRTVRRLDKVVPLPIYDAAQKLYHDRSR